MGWGGVVWTGLIDNVKIDIREMGWGGVVWTGRYEPMEGSCEHN
jgi:hypothetical protein